MGPIVVGIEGTKLSRTPLDWASGAAGLMGEELVLVTAAAPGGEAEARDHLGRLLSAAGVEGAHRPEVIVGDPRTALVEFAEAQDARLVVVGAGGEGWFPALHLGSVSHHLVHHLDCPVCVVPTDHGAFDASRIVVGLDGSAGSTAASRWASELARRAGGEVVAVHAWEPPVSRVHRDDELLDLDQADQACRRWVEELLGGVPTDVVVEEGIPAQVLVATTERSEAGLLVLGSRGARGFAGLRVGSVVLNALQHAAVPTLIVPPDPPRD